MASCRGGRLDAADVAFAFDDFADNGDVLAEAFELLFDGSGEGGLHDHAEADAHVENAAHFIVGDAAMVLEELEDGKRIPRGGVDEGIYFGVECADEVAGEARSGDVSHAGDHSFDAVGVQDFEDGLDVDACWGEEDVAEGRLKPGRGGSECGGGGSFLGGGSASFWRCWERRGGVGWGEESGIGAIKVECGVLNDFADEGIAVGVDAVGAEAEDNVTRLDAHGIDRAREFNNTDGEAGEVEIVAGVDPGHLGGLAAEEGATGASATFRDPFEDVAEHSFIDFANGDVIEEKEGFGTLDDHVVDVHADEVNTDRVKLAELRGDFDFGAAPVGTRDENRVFVVASEEFFVEIEAEEASEAAGIVDDARPVSTSHE